MRAQRVGVPVVVGAGGRPLSFPADLVDTHKRTNECDLMASIGHELWHAIELLSEPNVRDYHAAFSFFEREGSRDAETTRFETLAAIRTVMPLTCCAFDERLGSGRPEPASLVSVELFLSAPQPAHAWPSDRSRGFAYLSDLSQGGAG